LEGKKGAAGERGDSGYRERGERALRLKIKGRGTFLLLGGGGDKGKKRKGENGKIMCSTI